jgi:hypothetical protein
MEIAFYKHLPNHPKINLEKKDSDYNLKTSIHKLTALESLNLSGCEQLKELPTYIDKLTTL